MNEAKAQEDVLRGANGRPPLPPWVGVIGKTFWRDWHDFSGAMPRRTIIYRYPLDPALVYLEGEGVPDLYRPLMTVDEAKKVARADPRVVARKRGLARLKEFVAAAKLGKSFICHSPRMQAAIARANAPCPERLAREYAAL